jgi:hypothetical protein
MSDELERLRERVAKLEAEIDLLHALMPPEVGSVAEWRPDAGPLITRLENCVILLRKRPEPSERGGG